jgi:hypothetical protein
MDHCLRFLFLFAVVASNASATLISYTISGVTTLNFAEAGQLTANLPTGSAWTAVLEWDSATPTMSSISTQAQYRLSKFTLSLTGTGGATWTTSAIPSDTAPSFTTNYGARDEIQFTSGWGPSLHTNPTLYEWQTYSANVVLGDPTQTALASLTPVPTFLNLADWNTGTSYSYLKLYLNSSANRYILGRIDSITVTGAAVPEPTTTAAILGAVALGCVWWRRRRSINAA